MLQGAGIRDRESPSYRSRLVQPLSSDERMRTSSMSLIVNPRAKKRDLGVKRGIYQKGGCELHV
jgi:hypothetical protein